MKKLLFISILMLSLAASPAQADLTNSLSIGEKAADFTLPNAFGAPRTLSNYLKRGPVVLVFYRGGWCPVCNTHLNALQKQLKEIRALGADMVAITPETPDHAELTITKNALNFEVLSDHGNVLAKQYGILWEVPTELQDKYDEWLTSTYGKTLADYNDQEGFELPVPATFVLDKNGMVIWTHKDEDYQKRSTPEEILKALRGL